MTSEQIAELAKQILTGLAWAQWPFYLVSIALASVVTYFSARLSSYASKTGEITAMTSQFVELTKQLRTNTETVEKVKSEIAHGDWATREWKTIRRLKLEEMLKAVLQLKEWQRLHSRELLYASKLEAGVSPALTIELIGLLYFPELETEIRSFCRIHDELFSLALQIGQQLPKPTAAYQTAIAQHDINEAKNQENAIGGLLSEYHEKVQPLYERYFQAKSILDNSARHLLMEIVGM